MDISTKNENPLPNRFSVKKPNSKNGFKKVLNLIKSAFLFVLKYFLLKPLMIIGHFFYQAVVLNIYKLYINLTKKSEKRFSTIKNKFLYLFINRYLTHGLIVILGIIVIGINFQSKEVRAEEFGSKTILYNMVVGETLAEVTADETLSSAEQEIKSYTLAQKTSLKAPVPETSPVAGITEDENVGIASKNSNAIIKPDLVQTRPDKIIEYTVEPGDTSSTIAAKFSLKTSTLLWENGISQYSLIKPGQKLSILPIDGVTHTVEKGDTLKSIAKEYNAEEEDIIKYNKIANDTIYTDQLLIIPDGEKKSITPSTPTTATSRLVSVSKIFAPTKTVTSSSSQLLWPTTTHRISQYYHWRHTGLDIDGEFGDLIWASEAGTVTLSQCVSYGYGCYVIVDHGKGIQTLYAHFQKLYVKKGQSVTRGQVLGEMGSTGRSTGSHLHYEVRISGSRLNPLQYIR